MKAFLIIFSCCLAGYLIFFGFISAPTPMATVWKLPLKTVDRQDWSTVRLEPDAHFKSLRAPFGPVKLHYHTGIDLQNGSVIEPGEPVYAIAAGKVIAIEDPPPQRKIVIEHVLPDENRIWSVYYHIIGEQVQVGDRVDTETIIARIMNASELDTYGWEYNHVHLEIMKKLSPPVSEYYERKTFTCYSAAEVDAYFSDAEVWLKNHFEKSNFVRSRTN